MRLGLKYEIRTIPLQLQIVCVDTSKYKPLSWRVGKRRRGQIVRDRERVKLSETESGGRLSETEREGKMVRVSRRGDGERQRERGDGQS